MLHLKLKYGQKCACVQVHVGVFEQQEVMWDSLSGISSFEVSINRLCEGHGNGQSILGCQGHRAGTARRPWEWERGESLRSVDSAADQTFTTAGSNAHISIREVWSCKDAFYNLEYLYYRISWSQSFIHCKSVRSVTFQINRNKVRFQSRSCCSCFSLNQVLLGGQNDLRQHIKTKVNKRCNSQIIHYFIIRTIKSF